MDNSQIQTPVIKSSTEQVYEKSIKILAAIQNCGCDHCLVILRNGLRQPTPNPDTEPIPEPPEKSHV